MITDQQVDEILKLKRKREALIELLNRLKIDDPRRKILDKQLSNIDNAITSKITDVAGDES